MLRIINKEVSYIKDKLRKVREDVDWHREKGDESVEEEKLLLDILNKLKESD